MYLHRVFILVLSCSVFCLWMGLAAKGQEEKSKDQAPRTVQWRSNYNEAK
jgi:hypothetical protein